MAEVRSDEALARLMSQRDEEALLELHRRYAPYLTAVARRMLRDPDEVQQCVQDAFVNAWNYAERFDADKVSIKTWLVTICHRLAINRLRGEKLETMPLQDWDAPVRQADPVDRIYVERALEALEPGERDLIGRAFYQGYSHAQVAEETGKMRLRGALAKLCDHLKGGGA